VATISHELRTPLTPLKGFLAALLHGTVEDTPETRGEYYKIMLNQANRLERLITDLLEVSQIESDKPLVEGHAVELTAAAAEQVEEFSQHNRKRSIELRTPGDPIVVHADPVRLGQVMGNLITNAIKYSPEGTPIDIRVAREGERAVVSVRDEGEGIPEADQERVFGRFQRLDNSLTRQTGGTGLGLYIARRLVEAMGGRLWLDSKPGVGSTFSFSLPLAGRIGGNGRDRAGMLAGQP
jgi:signal transduction histidine kinase